MVQVCAAYDWTGTSQSPDVVSIGRTETSNLPALPAYGRTETSNLLDLPAYGRTETSNLPGACLWPDRNMKFAGPPCLWPDRERNLCAPRRTSLPMAGPATRFGTCKVSEWREGVQCKKHGYRKQSITRTLRPFPFPRALYARVLSKPG